MSDQKKPKKPSRQQVYTLLVEIGRKEGDEIDEDERALMARALDENSVIIAQMTPFFD